MADDKQTSSYKLQTSSGNDPQTIVVNLPAQKSRRWLILFLFFLLIVSVVLNLALLASGGEVAERPNQPKEYFFDGDPNAASKIAVVEITGTIMPPFTDRILESIRQAKEDDAVEGVLVMIDSPGGLVADSHEIYHRLKTLDKPVTIFMRRLAASGGLYSAMGCGPEGKIFAEPTTWTGSIGVIIPRYNAKELAEKIGVKSDPLKTGPLKNALDPFSDLTDQERDVWTVIMNESFDRFLNVIAENRTSLDREAVDKLATGQIYTADQALASGLIDEIGFREDAVDYLKEQLGLSSVKLVSYSHSKPLFESLVIGGEAQSSTEAAVSRLAENLTPRPYYLMSWGVGRIE